jgi:acyl carrier protein
MSGTEQKIIDGVKEVFMEIDDMPVSGGTRLGDIPGYDSMGAVNLQTYLQETFRTTVFLEILNEETTIGELASYMEDPEKMKKAMQKK